jgi:uncharacterized Zn finger protein
MNECPSCGSKEVHEVICGEERTEEGMANGFKQFDLYPIRPAPTFECQACKCRWSNPEFEKYLLQVTVKEAKINGE